MDSSTKISGRKFATISLISICAGVIGTLFGKVIGAAVQTSPAWVGPAILIGSIALILVGALLLPGAIREFRVSRSGPAA